MVALDFRCDGSGAQQRLRPPRRRLCLKGEIERAAAELAGARRLLMGALGALMLMGVARKVMLGKTGRFVRSFASLPAASSGNAARLGELAADLPRGWTGVGAPSRPDFIAVATPWSGGDVIREGNTIIEAAGMTHEQIVALARVSPSSPRLRRPSTDQQHAAQDDLPSSKLTVKHEYALGHLGERR